MKEENKGVEENGDSNSSAVEKCDPPPTMILTCKLEVEQGNGYEGSHNKQ